MKKSKILSVLIKRPLLNTAVIWLVICLIYVNLIYKFPTLQLNEGSSASFTGKLADFTYNSDGSVKSFSLKNIKKESRLGIDSSLNILCYVNNINMRDLPPLGALVRVTGKVKFFQKARNPGEFDAYNYYINKHVLFSLYDSQIEGFTPPANMIRDRLSRLRLSFTLKIRECCPLEYGTINTILWADKSNLPEDRKDLYKSVGLAHFLVISGLHIQLLGAGLYRLLKQTGIRKDMAALFAMSLMVLYGFFVGFQVSVVRAVIMFLVRMVGDIVKKPYDMLSALSLSAIVCLMKDPFFCIDTAFIYSYACVLAVALFMDKSENRKAFWELPLFLWLFLLPISLYYNYSVTLAAVALNLVLGVFAGPLLIISLLCFVFSLHNLTISAHICDFCFALIIRFMDSVCSLFSQSSLLILRGRPLWGQILVYYIFLTLFILFLDSQVRLFHRLFIYLSLTLLISSNLNFSPSFTMLDVGQGDCMVFIYMPGRCLIFDAGSSTKSNLTDYTLIPFLKYCGIFEISDIYLSHSDSDHVNAVPGLLEACADSQIRVQKITISEYSYKEKDENLSVILKKACEYRIPIELISKGQKKVYGCLKSGSSTVTCLWPCGTDSYSRDTLCKLDDSNSMSQVLMLSYGSFDIMLTGDATSETENLLLSQVSRYINRLSDKQIEVYKVAHHGSKYSSCQDYVNLINPFISLISVSRRNSYGHPHEETLQRLRLAGSVIHRTDYEGAIIIKLTLLPQKKERTLY